jgi:hypothetical protein
MEPNDLLKRIAQIRISFEGNFETPWLYMLLEGIPLDPILLKDVRDFLRLEEEWAVDETRAREGVHNLELFTQALRHYLLPCIKEKLRISPLKPETMISDRDQRTIRELVAYSVPIKVSLLEDQVKAFRLDLEQAMQAAARASAIASA